MVTTVPLGIIDSLSAGFAIVNKRLWLLLLPVLLDVTLVIGPGISIAPVVDEGVARFQASTLAQTGQDQAANDSSEESLSQMVKQSAEALGAFRETNLLGILAWQLPSLVSATSSTPLPKLRGAIAAEVAGGWTLLGSTLALALLSLLGVSLYLTIIAQALRVEAFSAGRLLRNTLRGWLRFCLFFAALLLIALPSSGALILLLATASLFGAGLLSLVSSLVLAVVLTASFYLFFVDDAIFFLRVQPLQAAWCSANVIWRNFWSALCFVLLVNLIHAGIPLAWRLIIENPFGLAAAILGQAYIATGLAAAGMLFFSQRYAAWQVAVVATQPPVRL